MASQPWWRLGWAIANLLLALSWAGAQAGESPYKVTEFAVVRAPGLQSPFRFSGHWLVWLSRASGPFPSPEGLYARDLESGQVLTIRAGSFPLWFDFDLDGDLLVTMETSYVGDRV